MVKLFLQILNMSVTGAIVILIVLALRLLLRRAPKKYSYWLWGAVGFRLLCPVSVSSVISIFNAFSLPQTVSTGHTITYLATDPITVNALPSSAVQPAVGTSIPAPSQVVQEPLSGALQVNGAEPAQVILLIGTMVWCLGMVFLLLYAGGNLWRLHRWVSTAIRTADGAWECEHLSSPFIMGICRPKIYLPYGLVGEERAYILCHEQYHLRRKDHWMKLLAFLLLTVHWFNPLAWVAFFMMARDMEMSCDEKVLSEGGPERKQAYSMSLLSFAVDHRAVGPSPLSFGETGVRARIQNVLRYRPAGAWIAVTAVLVCLTVTVACTTNPMEKGYQHLGIRVPLPEDYAEHVSITDPEDLPDDVILSVYDLTSQKDIGEDVTGWMFTIVRHNPASFVDYWFEHQMTGGSSTFARDEQYFYSIEFPTGVQESDGQTYQTLMKEFDLSKIVEANGLKSVGGSTWADSEYTYPGNHTIVDFTLSNGTACILVLSQPVRQGEGGIWCAERWYESNGEVHLIQPDTDLTPKAYYEALQANVDEGKSYNSTLVSDVVDTYLFEVLGVPNQILQYRTISEPNVSEAVNCLERMFEDNTIELWYQGRQENRKQLQIEVNLQPNPFVEQFKKYNWAQVEEYVPPEGTGSCICLGDSATNCFQFYLGTEYVTLVQGETRTTYQVAGQQNKLVEYLSSELYSREIAIENIVISTEREEAPESVIDRWLSAYREQRLNTTPGSIFAIEDLAVVSRSVAATKGSSYDNIFFGAELAIKPTVQEDPSAWLTGNMEYGVGEWEGWLVYHLDFQLQMEGDIWRCVDSGTGGLFPEGSI